MFKHNSPTWCRYVERCRRMGFTVVRASALVLSPPSDSDRCLKVLYTKRALTKTSKDVPVLQLG
eukprot:scaffold12730_cov62-Skeletonema_dohrnii-CCMP3373.AAC.1